MAFQSVGAPAGGNQISAATRKFYDKLLLANLKKSLRLISYAELRPMPAKAGQTINWRRMAPLPTKGAAPLTEGVTPTPSNISIAEVEASLFQFGDYVEFSDWIDMTGPDPLMIQTISEQAYQVALTLDDVLNSVFIAGTNVTYSGVAGSRATVTAAPAQGDLDDVIVALAGASVPLMTSWISPQTGQGTVPGEPAYIAFVTPVMWKDLKNLTDGGGNRVVDKASEYATEATRLPGEVGKYDRLRFVETTNGFVAAGAGSGGVDVHLMVAIGQGAIGRTNLPSDRVRTYVRPPNDMPDSADPLAQRGTAGWKTDFTAAILEQARMHRYEFASN